MNGLRVNGSISREIEETISVLPSATSTTLHSGCKQHRLPNRVI